MTKRKHLRFICRQILTNVMCCRRRRETTEHRVLSFRCNVHTTKTRQFTEPASTWKPLDTRFSVAADGAGRATRRRQDTNWHFTSTISTLTST